MQNLPQPEAESQPHSTDLSRKPRPEEALKAARQLLGSYRTGEANDPETFGGAVAAVLSLYPLHVVEYVCDPRTGLAGRSKWMPNAAEVKEACATRLGDLARIEKFTHFGEDRERKKDQGLLPPPRETRLSYDELKAKYGENWGINPPQSRSSDKIEAAPTFEEIAEHYAAHGLGFKPKAMP